MAIFIFLFLHICIFSQHPDSIFKEIPNKNWKYKTNLIEDVRWYFLFCVLFLFGTRIVLENVNVENCCCFSQKCKNSSWSGFLKFASTHLPGRVRQFTKLRRYTVQEKDLILRPIESRPQMQLSMARKFPLWQLRSCSVKHTKLSNFKVYVPWPRWNLWHIFTF